MNELLEKAKMWSVLYEEKDTKNKGAGDLENSNYFPNPIFTPYFGISYRKKRKLTITADDFLAILDGTDESFDQIKNKYEKKWGFTPSETGQTEMDF
ncbi:hypothetical protein WLQ65_22625 [Pseudoalteromonas piscicida]